MRNFADVAVIGAGPYGLSLAAHLRRQDVDNRVFGSPMESWRDAMPVGMKLKSEGFASNIADPDGAFSLSTFCKEANIPYADTNLPVTLSTFLAYGNAFQKRFVPELEQKMVVLVEPAPHGFNLHLANGEIAAARRTVIASGIRAFAYSRNRTD
jgi:cation diffusion facilitator CzcD-associated flavoprotein CzcO